MTFIAQLVSGLAELIWGPWLLALLLGGGCYFLAYSRLVPLRYFRHAVHVLFGRYDRDDDSPGMVSHFQALSSALAGTIGMANIASVAVAIQTGGPGAIFWMWICAIVGVATKFFTCTLAVQFRGRDSLGVLQGGPMYVIAQGLSSRWRPLATMFAVCALFGTAPVFQANQLAQILRNSFVAPTGLLDGPGRELAFNVLVGLVLAISATSVLRGGIQRVGLVASRLVPAMVVLYCGCGLLIAALNIEQVPSAFALILRDAFTGEAVAGGVIWTVFVTGIRRAAFSNEAGMGTEALAHGAAKTNEPTREGLVAMLGPVIDTLIVCTTTAVVILTTGAWQDPSIDGVSVTVAAFEGALPGFGLIALSVCVVFFACTTILTMGYYGQKSLAFLIGAERQHYYEWAFAALIVIASSVSLGVVVDFADATFGLMAIPTMISAIRLSPAAMSEARRYFGTLRASGEARQS